MSEVNESTAYTSLFDGDAEKLRHSYNSTSMDGGAKAASSAAPVGSGDWRYQVVEFAKGAAEMSVEFGKGVRDVVKQSILREDSVIVRKLKGPCERICEKFEFLNDYLPEDRDPLHSWSVIICVWVLALSVLLVSTGHDTTTSTVKKIKTHPPSASLILLPDGRHLGYQEKGVPAEQARFSMIVPHSFLSSRLAGIPGLKDSLLQNFGVRMVSYDLPGFGESDPHPDRDLETSALDILHLSYALNITEKFWVVAHSDGSKHAWAALRYIPDRLAGAILVAPMVNPYEPRMTKEERRKIWGRWTIKKKLNYQLARKFPRLLTYFYRKSFLSGEHGPVDEWLSLSLGSKDRALVERQMFEEFWQRDVEESVRQGNVKPLVEEAALHVSNWDFSIADLKVPNKQHGKGILFWLKSIYSREEDRSSGFLGPIHIWQGAEDLVVPPSTSDFVQRVLPDTMLHKLPYEGHFTYFFFCDECHRQMFTTVYGSPQGPLGPKVDQTPIDEAEENSEEEIVNDTTTEEDNVTCLTTDTF